MEETKKCPYCGEEININAVKCKHCGEWLPKQDNVAPQAESSAGSDSSTDKGCLFASAVVSLFIWAALGFAILYGAHCLVPSDERMAHSVYEDVGKCFKNKVADYSSLLGGAELGLLTNLFLDNNTATSAIEGVFDKYNRVDVERHWLYSEAKIVNDDNPDGKVVSVGFVGLVLPFVEWDDFILDPQTHDDSQTIDAVARMIGAMTDDDSE